MSNEAPSALKPVYVPYQTVDQFIESLVKNGVPAKIDKTAIPDLSSGMKAQLRSALKFLKLIGDDDSALPALRTLVAAKPDPLEWRAALTKALNDAYANIIGDFDLTSATPGTLQERFKERSGADGQVLEKATRFYLAAASAAGIPLSTFLSGKDGKPTQVSKIASGAPRTPKRAQNGPRGFVETQTAQQAQNTRSGWLKHAIALDAEEDGATVHVELPRKLTKAHVERLHKWLESLAFE